MSEPTTVLPQSSPSSSSTQQGDREAGLSTKDGESSSGRSTLSRIGSYLDTDIDSKKADLISIYACFLTGYTSSHSFSACYIWCGFQTGNVAQLGLAAARSFNPVPYRTYGFLRPDQQALCSLLTFLLGTSLGRIGDWIGAKKRKWLVIASFTQVLLAMAAALTQHFSGETGLALEYPNWTTPLGFVTLAFLSASLGLQGIIGKRVGSPLNTTIVLTTTWVEIFNDPFLTAMRPAASRDVRVSGVLMVFLGAFVARAVSGTSAGVAGSLGVLCGFRLIQVVWWSLIPAPPPKK